MPDAAATRSPAAANPASGRAANGRAATDERNRQRSDADADQPADLTNTAIQDGRHARRDRNKYAVVDAYLQLVREGDPRPSIAAVADRSGVSHRSVFRYFADKNELARTAIERQHAFASPLVSLTVGPGAPLPERIERFVERRLELFDAIAPVARLTRSLASMQPLLEHELTTSRAFLRSQLRHLFRAEVDALPNAHRVPALAALDALCSFEAVDLLLRDQGLAEVDAAATLRFAIARLLSH